MRPRSSPAGRKTYLGSFDLRGVTTVKWTQIRPGHPRNRARGLPIRTGVRPMVELLEPRLAPANVPVLSGHYDNFLSGANTQETTLTPATVNATNFGRLFNYPVD